MRVGNSKFVKKALQISDVQNFFSLFTPGDSVTCRREALSNLGFSDLQTSVASLSRIDTTSYRAPHLANRCLRTPFAFVFAQCDVDRKDKPPQELSKMCMASPR
ncbi:unnamed protein product [Scytosiphon promiscuus]